MTAEDSRAAARRSWNNFLNHGGLADLDAAVASFVDALGETSIGHPDHARALYELAAAKQVRYLHRGDADDLVESIELTRAAIAGHADPVAAAGGRSNLGNALRLAYEATGDLAALDESIASARAAVDATPTPHRSRATRLSNLGYALRLRFSHTGRSADIDAAVDIARSALSAAEPDAVALTRLSSNLGIALRERHERFGDADDLHEAIRLAVASVADTPADDPDRPGVLTNLGLALIRRFAETGRPADLDDAIVAHRAAVGSTATTNPDAAAYALNLATALRTRAEHQSGAPDLVDDAVSSAERAEALLPDGHPDHVLALSALGRALRLRYRRRAAQDDAAGSVRARRAAAAIATAPPEERAVSALIAAEWATEDGDVDAAASSYADAVTLLARVAWHGTETVDRQRQLGRWNGLASDAAASSLQDANRGRALELLEEGRSIVWSQTLQYRTDLGGLGAVAPALAERLGAVGSALAVKIGR